MNRTNKMNDFLCALENDHFEKINNMSGSRFQGIQAGTIIGNAASSIKRSKIVNLKVLVEKIFCLLTD